MPATRGHGGPSREPERIRYSEFEPDPSLAGHVHCYWEFVAGEAQPPYVHHVMPDGCVVLAYGRRGRGGEWLALVGPSLDGFRAPVEPRDRIWGVRFWPDAAGALLDLDPAGLRDADALLIEVLPELARDLEAQLSACRSAELAAAAFDRSLRMYLADAPPLDAIVRAGVEAVVQAQGRLAVAELAQRLGLSERQFHRRFRRAVGLTPKQFARIRRLRSSVANAMESEAKGWSRVAAEQGYADQAHLIREFSQLIGQSPTTFMERTRAIEHVNVTP